MSLLGDSLPQIAVLLLCGLCALCAGRTSREIAADGVAGRAVPPLAV
jgi:hypothetical protein